MLNFSDHKYSQHIAQHGFVLAQGVFSPVQVSSYLDLLKTVVFSEKSSGKGGIRDLFKKIPELSALADSKIIKNLVSPILGDQAFPVRAIFFDKMPEANWGVAWHQDVNIAVVNKVEQPGFCAWSVKEGVYHVQPPLAILQNMLTVRIHLDRADAQNGALWVVPGSHQQGRLSELQISQLTSQAHLCCVEAGEVLMMRPLLLHRSYKSTQPGHRRVIHIEFANQILPAPLQWYEQSRNLVVPPN